MACKGNKQLVDLILPGTDFENNYAFACILEGLTFQKKERNTPALLFLFCPSPLSLLFVPQQAVRILQHFQYLVT